MLRTAETQRSLLGSLGKPGGRQEEDQGLGSFCHSKSLCLGSGPLLAPNHRGSVTWVPVLVPLSLLVPWVTFCLHPLSPSSLFSHLCVTFSAVCLHLCALLLRIFLPPLRLSHGHVSRSPCFSLVCSSGVSLFMHFSCLSSPPSFMTSLCSRLPATFSQVTKSSMSLKRKKEKNIKTQKAKQKQILSVLQSAASSGGLCVPCGPQPARLPPRPLRGLPACPPAPPADDTEFSAWVFGDGY